MSQEQKQNRVIYKEKNKAEIAAKDKAYRALHREYFTEQARKRREADPERYKEKIVCACGSTCRKADLSTHKKTVKHIKWSKLQPDFKEDDESKQIEIQSQARLEQKRNYYSENKQDIKEKHKKNVTCECGCTVQSSQLNRHKLTAKHLKLMEKINNYDIIEQVPKGVKVEDKKEYVKCDCGVETHRRNYARHLKTKKHQTLLDAIKE
jgi:hypothetical protein